MNNVSDIKSNHLCYGCGTCNVLCGRNAITMRYDNIGRLLPAINEALCTDCGLCRSHCPSLDLQGIQLPETDDKYVGHIENVYIGRATDERIYRNSQSGGLATATVKYLFDSGKIDAAIMCRVTDAVEYTPKAVVITSADELYSCQRSSYVPIDIVSALKHVENHQSIAVVGTGCHIQGINALLHFSQKYSNHIKYKLGLICDRTLCKTVTEVLYDGRFGRQAKRIVWRDKSKNYQKARLLIQTANGRQKVLPRWKRFALKDPFTNPRCRVCFDKLNTGADIVFGDPWGQSHVDWKNGMSVVITRTREGEGIIKQLIANHQADMGEGVLSEVIVGQHIEKRKKDVSSALAHYQHEGWLMPTYAQQLQPSKENLRQSALIDEFITLANKDVDEIVQIARRKARRYIAGERINQIKRSIKRPFSSLFRLF